MLNLLDCPCCVFGNEWLGIVCRGFECGEIFSCSNIPERDANIPEKASAFDAFDRRAAEEHAKFFIGQSQVIAQSHRRDCRPRSKRCFTRYCWEAIPWAAIDAGIAAVDAIADERRQFE